MTVAFYKLQVVGNDFVLVDRDRLSQAELPDEEFGNFATAILDRRRGVGGRGVIFVGGTTENKTIPYRVFLSDGSEDFSSADALLCAARWAFDSGRGSLGKIRLAGPHGERTLTALDSRSFALELAGPFAGHPSEKNTGHGDEEAQALNPEDGTDARVGLVVDGRAAAAYLLNLDRTYAVAVAGLDGPGPKRVRTALAELFPAASPIVVRPAGRDLVRFTAAESADRVSSAAAAVAAAILASRVEGEAAAEWRGRGGAVTFANFGDAGTSGPSLGRTAPGVGTSVLVDRGRFWVQWKKSGRILVTGLAEYSFDGNYDFYVGTR